MQGLPDALQDDTALPPPERPWPMLKPTLLAHSPTEAAELRATSPDVAAGATHQSTTPILAANTPTDRSAEAIDMEAGSPVEHTHMQPSGPAGAAASTDASNQQHDRPAAADHPEHQVANSASACSTVASLSSGMTEGCGTDHLLATV